MAIRFIPNDPMAGGGAPPPRRKTPTKDRPAGRAGFTLFDPEPEGVHPPGSPEFLFWQCREAALLAVLTWERHAGSLHAWQAKRRRLDLIQNAVRQRGQSPEPNAFYDRSGFLFFESTASGQTTLSGASTDVVAHEVGHGLLDAIRPDLWDTPFLEVGAFHEASGDCMSLLTALGDAKTRTSLLAIGLGKRNFVETTAEELSAAIRRIDPTHNAATPRRARNTLAWQLPATLPMDGGPGQLINESHSFARVFTGCFWDLLRNLLGSGTTSKALDAATRTAARLLIRGVAGAPEEARFFQAVGRAMVLADEEDHAGVHHPAIREAFAAHGIALGSNAMLAPVATLDGPSPATGGRAAGALSAATRRDLMGRLGAGAHARMVVRRRDIGGTVVVHAVHQREVPLGPVSSRLEGVVAFAPEGVLVGTSGRRAAVLGALPERSALTDEVESYVGSLVAHGRIDFGAKASASPRAVSWHSHAVRSIAGRRVLTRMRFACGA